MKGLHKGIAGAQEKCCKARAYNWHLHSCAMDGHGWGRWCHTAQPLRRAARMRACTALVTNSVYRCQAFYATLLRLCPARMLVVEDTAQCVLPLPQMCIQTIMRPIAWYGRK